MKAVVLTKKQLQAITPEQKETKRGVQEYREFRIGGVYGNFWGPVNEKSYEFTFVPRDANDESKGGTLRFISQRAVTEIAQETVKIVEAKPIQQPSLLALLNKKKAVVATADEDEDDE